MNKLYDDATFDEYYNSLYSNDKFFKDNIAKPSEILKQFDEVSYNDNYETWKIAKKNELLSIKDSADNFKQLVYVVTRKRIVPFIGAGMSIPLGHPGWTQFLIKQAKSINKELEIQGLIDTNKYEEAATSLISAIGVTGFNSKVDANYTTTGNIIGPIKLLPKISNGCLVTTNFDNVLEKLYLQAGIHLNVINGTEDKEFHRALAKGDDYLLKLHGSINDTSSRVFTQEEYQKAYLQDGEIDVEKVLPNNLMRIFVNYTFLFVGASLQNDQTMILFKKIIQDIVKDETKIPRHYAIVESPESEDELIVREKFLTEHMIFPIWYPHGEHNKIEDLLQMIIYEVENE